MCEANMLTATNSRTTVAERRFFAAMAFISLVVVFAGFATSYYLWPLTRATHFPAGQPISPSLPSVVHLHALAFSGWIVLLAVQGSLVVRGDVASHRRLGRLGAALLPIMVFSGLVTAVTGARAGWNPGGPYRDALSFMFVGVADLLVFTSLTGAGLVLRARPEIHKRLMLLGTIGGLMWPAITRMPIVAGRLPLMFGLLVALVFAPAIRDFVVKSQARWLSLGVAVGILATFPLRVAIGNSEAWRSVAEWFVH
jgi:hypothetical protein